MRACVYACVRVRVSIYFARTPRKIFKNNPRKPPMLPVSIAAQADCVFPFFQYRPPMISEPEPPIQIDPESCMNMKT